MAISGGYVFGIPSGGLRIKALSCAATHTQQGAIAAARERQSVLDKANGSAAQIMGLPGTLGNAARPEQNLRYGPVAVALGATIKRPERERQPLTSLN